MSNVWKVVIGICVAIALLIVIALGAVYFAWQHSQKIAQEIYGGPLPKSVVAILAMDMPGDKMGVFLDREVGLALVLIDSPLPPSHSPEFSEPDVKGFVSYFNTAHPGFKSYTAGYENGTPGAMILGKHIVHVLKSEAKGKQNEVGILNLSHDQLMFIGVEPPGAPDTNISEFLNQMPHITADPRFLAPEPTGKKSNNQ